MGLGSSLKKASTVIDTGISSFFRWEGKLVARNPILTIILTVALAGFLGVYGIVFNFYEEVNPAELYAAKDAPSVPDKEYVEGVYGFRSLEERILASLKGDPDANLLENPQKSFGEMMDLWEEIQNLKSNSLTNFQQLCVRPKRGHPCKVSSILGFWDFNRTKLESDPDPLRTISTGVLRDGYGIEIQIEHVLGGIKRDRDGMIVSATVFQTIFHLELTLTDVEKRAFDLLRESGQLAKEEKSLAQIEDLLDKNFDPRPVHFDRMLAKVLKKWDRQAASTLTMSVTHSFRVQEESNEAIRQDMVWILLTSILVGVFSNIVLFRNNWALCKLHMVQACFFSIGLAVAAAFGLALILNVSYNLIVTTVPFLLLGLGVDDTFIILGQFRRTDRRLPPEERMSIAMSRAGSSIFVTSLTDLVAFMLCLSSSVPALQQFGAYASFGVLFDFFFQVTTFVAFASLEARREHRLFQGARSKKISSPDSPDSNGSTPIKSMEAPTQVSPIHRSANPNEMWTDGINSVTINPEVSNKLRNPKELPVERRPMCGDEPHDPDAPSLSTKLFGEWIPSVTMTPWGTATVLLIEVALIVGATYGCTKTSVDLQFRKWFAPEGWLHDGFYLENKYFNGEQRVLNVYTKEGSYFYNQQGLLDCAEAIAESEHVADVPTPRSWFLNYVQWSQRVHGNETSPDGFAPTSSVFMNWVMEFLGSQEGAYFNEEVIFSADRSEILSSRLVEAHSVNMASGLYAITVMEDLRDAAEANVPALGPIVYNEMFPFYDGLRIIEYETVRNVAIVGAAVFVVVTLAIANVFAAFLVFLMIALTDVLIFGYMWYVGLSFNMVTSVNIVLAVGIAVDYAVHIAHNFLVQTGTRKERAVLALQTIGGEVSNAAFTSFLAVIGLAFTKHYVMQVFFKMFSVIIVFGAWHGIVILPMLLSYIGPSPYSSGSH